MERSVRTRLVVGAGVCTILAVFGWIVAIHATVNTQEVSKVIVKANNGRQLVQGKIGYLFVFPIFQTFICVMFLHQIFRWNSTIRRLKAKAAPKDLWTEPTIGQYRFATVLYVVTLGLCMFSMMSAYGVVERAEHVLSK